VRLQHDGCGFTRARRAYLWPISSDDREVKHSSLVYVFPRDRVIQDLPRHVVCSCKHLVDADAGGGEGTQADAQVRFLAPLPDR